MDLITFTKSETFKKILMAVGGAAAVILIFDAGMYVGFHKAALSYGMGDNFYRAFDADGKYGNPFGDDFPDAHGASGKIVSVAFPVIVVDDHGTEKTVLLEDETTIRNPHGEASSTALTVGGFVVILGEPNTKSELEAKLIRILPAPATTTSPR